MQSMQCIRKLLITFVELSTAPELNGLQICLE